MNPSEIERALLTEGVKHCNNFATRKVMARPHNTELSALSNSSTAAAHAHFVQYENKPADDVVVRRYAGRINTIDQAESLAATKKWGEPILISRVNPELILENIVRDWKSVGLYPYIVISVLEVHYRRQGSHTENEFAEAVESLEKQGFGYRVFDNLTQTLGFSLSAEGLVFVQRLIREDVDKKLQAQKAANPPKKIICDKCGASDLQTNYRYNSEKAVTGNVIEKANGSKPFPNSFVYSNIKCLSCGIPLLSTDGKFREGVLQD